MHVLHEPISVGYSDLSDPNYHYYIKVPVTNESQGLSNFIFQKTTTSQMDIFWNKSGSGKIKRILRIRIRGTCISNYIIFGG